MMWITNMLDALFHTSPVFLSPHYDDVCFSLGGVMSAFCSRGTLINVFTRSIFTTNAATKCFSLDELISRVTKDREDEDLRFAEELGLDRLDLGFSEPALRGRKPFGLLDLAVLSPLARVLYDALCNLSTSANGDSKRTLFVPAGYGGHVDHVAVYNVVLAKLGFLMNRFNVVLYRELPYGLSVRSTNTRTAQLYADLCDLKLNQATFHLTRQQLDHKRRLVQYYETQRGVFPIRGLAAPEVIWSLTTS